MGDDVTWVASVLLFMVAAGALGAAWPVWLMRRLGPSDRPAIIWARRVALVLIGLAFLFLVLDLYADFRVLSGIERRARGVSLSFAVSETRARYAMHLLPGMGVYLVTTLIARYAPPRSA